MKTNYDSADEISPFPAKAPRPANTGSTLRGLSRMASDSLDYAGSPRKHVLPDLRAGDTGAADPLEQYSWPELRELIYGDPGTR